MQRAVFAALALAMAGVVQAKDTITISEFTPFAEDSGATDNVKEECGMQERIPKYLKSEAKKVADIIFTTEPLESVEGKVLYMEITHVFAPGGGGYSGAKNVEVEGELRENGEVIASFTVDRAALFGMTPGTCSMLKRVAKKIGEDVAEWLEAPEMDAMLGDAAPDD
jgi:hypothetical protein